MAPFPESEDMTVKRLYVALKRGDMQLLQMGAHKLHEKFYTGYTFVLLDDLKRILAYVEEQSIPNDIKELLTTTINKILNGEKPEKTVIPLEFIGEETRIEERQEQAQNEYQIKEEKEIGSAFLSVSSNETPLNEVSNTVNHYENGQINSNVAIFYDDSTPYSDYVKNKMYRADIEASLLGKETNLMSNLIEAVNLADTETDGLFEIVRLINKITGKVFFVTASKSKNIIKSFVDNNLDFDIPLVSNFDKRIKLIPLFGLSNIFVCPKCGQREYFAGMHNKVLSLQCKKCASIMYPDITEVNNFETNSNPYVWMFANNALFESDTWVLINPSIDNKRVLISEFLKMAYKQTKPKNVYLFSKETSKKDFYKQMFEKINPSCNIRVDFTSENVMCEAIERELTAKVQV